MKRKERKNTKKPPPFGFPFGAIVVGLAKKKGKDE
jgi:hypothetical protein